MTSNRPYLLRALNEWIIDNGMTPYILVDAKFPGTSVPKEFIQDGKIVLNISPAAVKDLIIDSERMTCNARFGGKSLGLQCPVAAISAIYARENGHGMIFPEEDTKQDKAERSDETTHKKPDLRVIK
jgi:stringent starvation protein B